MLDVDRAKDAHVWPPVVAIDPGSRETGICLRAGTAALEAVTVVRAEENRHHAAMITYATAVLEAVRELVRRQRDALNAEADTRGVNPPPIRHAVETLVMPTARPVKGRRLSVAPRVLESLPIASTVLGLIVGTWPKTILVPPRGEPGWDAVDAPSNLRGRPPRGWLKGGADRSHQRSAWAIAGAAHAAAEVAVGQQAARAVRHVVALSPSLEPAFLVPVLRRAVAETNAWDIYDRLDALAASVAVTITGDRDGALFVRDAVTAYLEESK